jgi:hypothetical protein
VAQTTRMSDAGTTVDPSGIVGSGWKRARGPWMTLTFVGSDWLSNATAITFVAGMRGTWTHTGSAPILGGGLASKTAPPQHNA